MWIFALASAASGPSDVAADTVTMTNCPGCVVDYEEITPCLKEVTKVWDRLLTTSDRSVIKFDLNTLVNAVKDGMYVMLTSSSEIFCSRTWVVFKPCISPDEIVI